MSDEPRKDWDAQGESGQAYGLTSRNKNPGPPITDGGAERDEHGNPVGHPSFAGGASKDHGLPTADDEEE